MDDRWESEITEYGAINITGFRIVDTDRRYVREFLDGWKRLDPSTSIGAGKESITVCSKIHTQIERERRKNRKSKQLCLRIIGVRFWVIALSLSLFYAPSFRNPAIPF